MSRQRSALAASSIASRRRLARLVVLVGLLGAAGAEARRPRRPAARAGNAQPSSSSRRPTSASGGTVQFVTDKRAYLNRGSRDGLAIKQSIQILRGGRSVASCVVDSVADHQATCAGGRPRVGDSFRLPTPGAALKHEAPPPELPPLTDEETLRARAAAVADARYDKVDFTGVRAFAAHTQAALSPSYVIWHSDPDPRGDYSLEQVDGLVHVYDLGRTGVDFHAAFTAQHWGSRASIGRFQPAAPSQFYLWQAELSRRRFDASTVFAVGRVWPWHAPGLTILDGFQIGRQSEDQTKEAGLYAGFLPTATTVAPSTAAWAAGAYGTLVETGGTRSALRLARQEGRIGVWGGAGAGTATDGEAFAQAWLGAWNVGGGGRAVYAPSIAPGIAIDRAYLDLGARPSLPFAMGAHVRYFGAALPAMAMLAAVTPTARGSVHAIGDAHWDLASWIGVGGFGGFNQDRDTGRSFSYAAAELRLPRVADGVAFGAELETGWLRGGQIYGHVLARLGGRVRLLARLTASATEYTSPTLAANVDEIGGYVDLDGALTTWLRLRAWSLVRAPILIQGALPSDPSYGAILGLNMTGRF